MSKLKKCEIIQYKKGWNFYRPNIKHNFCTPNALNIKVLSVIVFVSKWQNYSAENKIDYSRKVLNSKAMPSVYICIFAISKSTHVK